jgi:hypothetical protein
VGKPRKAGVHTDQSLNLIQTLGRPTEEMPRVSSLAHAWKQSVPRQPRATWAGEFVPGPLGRRIVGEDTPTIADGIPSRAVSTRDRAIRAAVGSARPVVTGYARGGHIISGVARGDIRRRRPTMTRAPERQTQAPKH